MSSLLRMMGLWECIMVVPIMAAGNVRADFGLDALGEENPDSHAASPKSRASNCSRFCSRGMSARITVLSLFVSLRAAQAKMTSARRWLVPKEHTRSCTTAKRSGQGLRRAVSPPQNFQSAHAVRYTSRLHVLEAALRCDRCKATLSCICSNLSPVFQNQIWTHFYRVSRIFIISNN